ALAPFPVLSWCCDCSPTTVRAPRSAASLRGGVHPPGTPCPVWRYPAGEMPASHGHHHDHGVVDRAAWSSTEGIKAIKISTFGLSMAAAVVGILGNEAVAQYKIRVGRRIGSVALKADGVHSRIDGFVSAGALVGLAGVAFGFPKADPIAALAITAVIVWVTAGTARGVIGRGVDAVDPTLTERIEPSARSVDGVLD